jgi:hypothetical protein
VDPVPSGPTNEKGPYCESLAAAWNFSDVFAGVDVVHVNVVQVGELPLAGFASFSDEIKSPDGK